VTTLKRAIFVSCVVITLSAVIEGEANADRSERAQFAATALALPAAAGDGVQAEDARFATAHARKVTVAGVATTSLTCDACTGQSVTYQVVYAGTAGSVVAGNVATAWASGCTGCHGWALSLQLVIATSARSVTAANRALALDAACAGCATAAAAIQIVVVGAPGRRLSKQAIAAINAQRDQLIARLTSMSAQPSPAAGKRAVPQASPRADAATDGALAAATARIEDVLTSDLRASSSSHQLRVSRG
jgi:hypothetical protein